MTIKEKLAAVAAAIEKFSLEESDIFVTVFGEKPPTINIMVGGHGFAKSTKHLPWRRKLSSGGSFLDWVAETDGVLFEVYNCEPAPQPVAPQFNPIVFPAAA